MHTPRVRIWVRQEMEKIGMKDLSTRDVYLVSCRTGNGVKLLLKCVPHALPSEIKHMFAVQPRMHTYVHPPVYRPLWPARTPLPAPHSPTPPTPLSRMKAFAKSRKRDLYVIGAANVGKSTFINRLIEVGKSGGSKGKGPKGGKGAAAKANKKDKGETLVTTSALPGTTLNFIEVCVCVCVCVSVCSSLCSCPPASLPPCSRTCAPHPHLPTDPSPPPTHHQPPQIDLGDKVSLFDTPGLILPHQLTTVLTTEELRAVIPQKRWVCRVGGWALGA
jgi:ribosome biogenesis GTPase A